MYILPFCIFINEHYLFFHTFAPMFLHRYFENRLNSGLPHSHTFLISDFRFRLRKSAPQHTKQGSCTSAQSNFLFPIWIVKVRSSTYEIGFPHFHALLISTFRFGLLKLASQISICIFLINFV